MVASLQQMPISGTGLPTSGTFMMVQLFAKSGLCLIPVLCDDYGRIIGSGF